MNVRVSAILLTAAIFMAVWDADQKGITKDRQRIARARAAAAEVASVAPQKSVGQAVPVVVSTAAAEVRGTDVRLSADERLIPLPSRLAAGVWLVVDETGVQRRITVHTGPETGAEHNFCIVTGEQGQRWCFVREVSERTTELPSSTSQQ